MEYKDNEEEQNYFLNYQSFGKTTKSYDRTSNSIKIPKI